MDVLGQVQSSAEMPVAHGLQARHTCWEKLKYQGVGLLTLSWEQCRQNVVLSSVNPWQLHRYTGQEVAEMPFPGCLWTQGYLRSGVSAR